MNQFAARNDKTHQVDKDGVETRSLDPRRPSQWQPLLAMTSVVRLTQKHYTLGRIVLGVEALAKCTKGMAVEATERVQY